MLVDLNSYVNSCAPRVASSTMLAIIKTESKGNPLAIGLNDKHKLRYQAKNLEQAVAWADYLERHNYNFDIGLGQVNIKNVHKYGYKAREMLDPCKNLLVASDILQKSYHNLKLTGADSKSALFKAISAYNTGNYRGGFNNGYVYKVIKNSSDSSFGMTYKSLYKTNANLLAMNSKVVIYARNKAELQKDNKN